MPLASWFDPATDGRRSKAGWALESLAAEYWKTAHYSLVIFTVIGLFAVRRRFADPRVALLLIFAVVDAAALWTLAWVAGYVSQRHTLPIALVSCVLAACAARRWGSGPCSCGTRGPWPGSASASFGRSPAGGGPGGWSAP